MNKENFEGAFDDLTPPRKKVLLKLLAGKTDKEIAESLYIAEPTVRKHIEAICKIFKCEPDEHRSKRPYLIALFRKYKPELFKEFNPPVRNDAEALKTAGGEGNKTISSSQDCLSNPGGNSVERESANTEPHQEEEILDSKLETQRIQLQIEKTLEDKANISQEKLFGIEEYIAILRKYLQDKESSWFISLVGSGGVGKTSVVEKLVREYTVELGFVDLAWVTAKKTYFLVENRSIRDIGTALNINALISEIAEQLHIKLPPIVDDHLFCLQNHLKAKPCLIVIDNLETLQDYTDLIEQFNPNSQKNNLKPSKLLFTSRVKIQKLTTQVREVELKGIDVKPTLELIRYKGAHIQRIKEALEEELLPIFYATNGIPLLILLVVSLIATDDSPLDEIIQSLLKQEELYKYLYEESLSSISDNAFKILTSMTDFSESIPVNRQQLRQQAELGDDEFKEAVRECIERCLLTSISKSLSDEPRYSIHNLLYEFLRDLQAND